MYVFGLRFWERKAFSFFFSLIRFNRRNLIEIAAHVIFCITTCNKAAQKNHLKANQIEEKLSLFFLTQKISKYFSLIFKIKIN